MYAALLYFYYRTAQKILNNFLFKETAFYSHAVD